MISQDDSTSGHAALRAWNELHLSRAEPSQIRALQVEGKAAVYRLEAVAPDGSAVIAKRCKEHAAAVEQAVYEEILPDVLAPTLHYYGCVADRGGEDGWYWLFLEDASGETFSHLREEHRVIAARWLGLMHLSSARAGPGSRLPERGPDYYLRELQSTRSTIIQNLHNPALEGDDIALLERFVSQFDLLESRWSQVVTVCNRMPRTLVHGDFAEKNMRVRGSEAALTLLPFDWEMAGWGTPAVDLAQLVRPFPQPLGRRKKKGSPTSVALREFSSHTGTTLLTTYLSIIRDGWPDLRVTDMKDLVRIGTIFRWVLCISWECHGLVYDRWAGRGLEKECAKGTMRELQVIAATRKTQSVSLSGMRKR